MNGDTNGATPLCQGSCRARGRLRSLTPLFAAVCLVSAACTADQDVDCAWLAESVPDSAGLDLPIDVWGVVPRAVPRSRGASVYLGAQAGADRSVWRAETADGVSFRPVSEVLPGVVRSGFGVASCDGKDCVYFIERGTIGAAVSRGGGSWEHLGTVYDAAGIGNETFGLFDIVARADERGVSLYFTYSARGDQGLETTVWRVRSSDGIAFGAAERAVDDLCPEDTTEWHILHGQVHTCSRCAAALLLSASCGGVSQPFIAISSDGESFSTVVPLEADLPGAPGLGFHHGDRTVLYSFDEDAQELRLHTLHVPELANLCGGAD